MADTISELTDAELFVLAYQKRMRWHNAMDLDNEQLYAVALIKLNNAVVPGDYPTLKTAIEGISGVQTIDLLVDTKTTDSVNMPVGTKLVVHFTADINLAPE